jgi:hypothetical protein
MDVEQLKEDVHAGRIPIDRLIDVTVMLQREAAILLPYGIAEARATSQ